MTQPLFIITCAMAAGKSTIAKALVQRFEKSAHVGGDAFLRMIARGGAVMGPVLDAEARAQLTLRQEIAAEVARRYHASGFAVVYQDILIGQDLVDAVARLADLEPRVVVLAPSVAALAARDAARSKTGYGDHFPPDVLAKALAAQTPRDIGQWIDSSAMSVDQVVEAILAG
jgi:chloramphenicol 3-O-phosphotransferase